MKRAEWAGAVLAESDDIVMVEGNAYFFPRLPFGVSTSCPATRRQSPYATSSASGFPGYWHEKCILS